MSKLKDIPLLVVRLIMPYLVDLNESANKRLTYLGVCQAWRQIALPLVYSTVFVKEYNTSPWAKANGWKEPDFTGRLWDINVASFNACEASRYAKRIDIRIDTPEGFFRVLEMVERMFNFVPYGWKRVHELSVGISIGSLTQNSENVVAFEIESLVTLLLNKVPVIHNIVFRRGSCCISFDPLYRKLVAAYSKELYILRVSSNVNLGHSLSLKNVTVLDIDLHKRKAHVLSCFEPQILQKLRIGNIDQIYIWKYFAMSRRNPNQLEFTALTDLELTFTSWYQDFESDSDSSSDFVKDIDYCWGATHKVHSIPKFWKSDMLKPNIKFPRLENLNLVKCKYVSFFFCNCEFPRKLEFFNLFTTADFMDYNAWIMDNIAAKALIVKIVSGEYNKRFKEEFVDFLGNHLGSKISEISLNIEFNLNPLSVHLPLLKRLDIRLIEFRTLIALIPRLPRLRSLSLNIVHFNMITINGAMCSYDSSGRPDQDMLREILAEYTGSPTTPTIIKSAYQASTHAEVANLTRNSNLKSLSIKFFVSEDMDSACGHIKNMLAKLSKLQAFAVNEHYVDDIKTFAIERQHIYPHFRSLTITKPQLNFYLY